MNMSNDNVLQMKKLHENFEREQAVLALKIKEDIVSTIKDIAKKNGNDELPEPILKLRISLDNVGYDSSQVIDIGYWLLLRPKEKFGREDYKFFHRGYNSDKNNEFMTGEIIAIAKKMIEYISDILSDHLVLNAISDHVGYIFIDLTK